MGLGPKEHWHSGPGPRGLQSRLQRGSRDRWEIRRVMPHDPGEDRVSKRNKLTSTSGTGRLSYLDQFSY